MIKAKTLKCSECGRGLQDGDQIQATVISVYHEINKPAMDQFQYAISRPRAATNVKHLYCGED